MALSRHNSSSFGKKQIFICMRSKPVSMSNNEKEKKQSKTTKEWLTGRNREKEKRVKPLRTCSRKMRSSMVSLQMKRCTTTSLVCPTRYTRSHACRSIAAARRRKMSSIFRKRKGRRNNKAKEKERERKRKKGKEILRKKGEKMNTKKYLVRYLG